MKIVPLINIEAKRPNFLLESFLPLPEYAVTLISATGGTGKTRLSLVLADRYVKETKQRATLWLTEDYEGQVRFIFNEMVAYGLVSESSLSLIDLILENPPQLAKREMGIFKANYEEITKIGESLIKNNTGFAVFDPLLAFYGGNENDNSEARVFIQGFANWARDAKITTIIIHHSNKDGASRGATAFHDGVRARYEITAPLDEKGNVNKDLYKNGIREIHLKKDNWGIRTPFYRMSDGQDSIIKQIMPPLKVEHKEVTFQNEIEEDDTSFNFDGMDVFNG